MGPASASTACAKRLASAGSAMSAAKVQTLRPRSRTSSAVRASAVGIAGIQHDVGAGLGRRQRDDPAETAAAAGDEQRACRRAGSDRARSLQQSPGSNAARQPFTTPSIRPLKKSFWAKAKAMMPGVTTMHIDGGERRPGPLAEAALGAGKHHRHGARDLVVGQRRAEQELAPGGDEVDDEDDHQAVPHHRQADHPQRLPGPAPSTFAASNISCGTSWKTLRMIRMLIARLSVT